ncbi:MAG: hypothetical protein RLZZ196_2242 [Bacteroidota bacterium]|jgi:hypothetical protein
MPKVVDESKFKMTDKTETLKFDEGKLPYYTVLNTQFPFAIREVVKRSLQGHEKYEKGDDWDNWFRIGEQRGIASYENALLRHLFKDGEDNELEHDVAVAWNAIARLEYKLRKKMYK